MNKCKKCPWHNKPYWSIINPCDTCPYEYDNIQVLTRLDITTNEKPSNDYIGEILKEVDDIQVRYTKPSLVRNYTDKDYAIGRYEKLVYKMIDMINNLQKENNRLNNIINELEKYLKEKQTLCGINQQGFSWGVAEDCLKKLQELKEGK